ncbi:hypothetical protein V2J09_016224 [Rumex salicifolius]
MASEPTGLSKHYSSSSKDEDVSDDVASLQLDIKKLSLHNSGPEGEIKKKKKFLLILDLNGLLIHRAHMADKSKIPNNRQPDAVFGNKLVFKRPYCKELMRFCLDRFEVGIWSSAMEHNVDAVMEVAFGQLKSKLLFVWNQTQCSDYGFKCVDNKQKPLFFKELKKVWEGSHNKQFRKGSFSATHTNTLLLDDTPSKGLLNPHNTGIYLDSYDPEDINDNALDPEGELGAYLKALAEVEEVPSYVASHPFGQAAITPDHPQWHFYSKVLHFINAS